MPECTNCYCTAKYSFQGEPYCEGCLTDMIEIWEDEIESIKQLDNLTKEVSLVNYSDNITIFLSSEVGNLEWQKTQ